MWRAISTGILIMVTHCVFQILGMSIVYAACRTLVAVGLNDWVFPVWLVGIPFGFIVAVIATIRLGRVLKL